MRSLPSSPPLQQEDGVYAVGLLYRAVLVETDAQVLPDVCVFVYVGDSVGGGFFVHGFAAEDLLGIVLDQQIHVVLKGVTTFSV